MDLQQQLPFTLTDLYQLSRLPSPKHSFVSNLTHCTFTKREAKTQDQPILITLLYYATLCYLGCLNDWSIGLVPFIFSRFMIRLSKDILSLKMAVHSYVTFSFTGHSPMWDEIDLILLLMPTLLLVLEYLIKLPN